MADTDRSSREGETLQGPLARQKNVMADWLVAVKTSTWCKHLDHWRFVRVFQREVDLTVVEPTFIWAVSEPKDDIMPLKHVLALGKSDEILQVFSLLERDQLFC